MFKPSPTVCVIALGVFLLDAVPSTGDDTNTGRISGKLTNTKTFKSVVAVHRATKRTFPGQLDRDTGRFSIAGLPLNARYDGIIEFSNSRLEGINLQVPRSDYEEEQPLSPEDVQTIRAKVRRMNKFEDVVEIKTIQGNIQHAAILISKLRTRPFFGSKPGEVIWRAELWHFERPEETWLKVQDELFIVLHRERISKLQYDKKALTFDPALGGITLSKQRPRFDLQTVQPPAVKPGIHFRTVKSE
jgi:hypothetical protein